MEVSGLFALQPLYPWGKSLCYALDRKLGGFQNRCERYEGAIKLWLVQSFIPI
jgi:hypothetical protein